MHTIEKHYYLIAEDSVTFPAQANTIKSDMMFPTDNRTTDKMPNGEAHIFRTQFLRVRLCHAAIAALLEPYNKSAIHVSELARTT